MLENNALALKIKELKRNGSYRDMSEKTGERVSHTYFSTLVNGDSRTKQPIKPSPDKLKIIASAYPGQTSYKELMALSGYEEQEIKNDDNKTFDLKNSEHNILTYGGKPISDDDWNIIKRILDSGQSE